MCIRKKTMPPRRSARNNHDDTNAMTLTAIAQLVSTQIAAAFAEYEANGTGGNGRTGSGTAGDGSGGNGTGGDGTEGDGIGGEGNGTGGTAETNNGRKGCICKTFLGCNPRSFAGTEGAVGICHTPKIAAETQWGVSVMDHSH